MPLRRRKRGLLRCTQSGDSEQMARHSAEAHGSYSWDNISMVALSLHYALIDKRWPVISANSKDAQIDIVVAFGYTAAISFGEC